MTTRKFISRFSPNRTDPEDLEKIHVQRHALLDEVVDLIRESARTKNKHHLLFVGSRGCGKTHLLSLINHRLGKQADLGDRLRIAWLNEDETSTSFLDILVRIYQALSARYPEEFPRAEVESLFGHEPDKARTAIGEALIRFAGKHTILVLIENLDGIFENLDEGEQRTWRSFIQNHPIFATVATAQALIAGVADNDQPFFGFFDTRHLQRLTADEATELLQKIALLNGNTDLEGFLKTPRGRARIRAIHHLSHGNHRLYVVLSELINAETLDALVQPFEAMVDEQLTPYYQERLRWLSPLQRKIVEMLCQQRQPVSVKDIAERLFASHSTITPQLKVLREWNYVVSNPRGRESLYELAEPLMRLSMQVKDTAQAEPLGVIVDFLRVWYERDELEDRLAHADPGERIREYLMAALAKLQSGEPNLRHELLRSGLEDVDLEECDAEQIERLRTLAEETNSPTDWRRYGTACGYQNSDGLAAEAFTRAIENAPSDSEEYARALYNRYVALSHMGREQEAMADCSQFICLPQAPAQLVAHALYNRAVDLGQSGRKEEAVRDYTAAIELGVAPAEVMVPALFNRAIALGEFGRREEAVSDYTRVISFPNADGEMAAMARFNRGSTLGDLGRTEEEIADYTVVIEMPDVPSELFSRALQARGSALRKTGRLNEAITDSSKVVDLPNSPPEVVAQALIVRASALAQTDRGEDAVHDCTRVVGLPGALSLQVDTARALLALLFLHLDHWEAGMKESAVVLARQDPVFVAGLSEVLIPGILRHFGSPQVWPRRVQEVVDLFAAHRALGPLGDSLVRHLSWLATAAINSEGLGQWFERWNSSANEHEAMRLPLRLLRVGIDYLASQPRDPGKLLQLPAEERSILQEVLSLPT